MDHSARAAELTAIGLALVLPAALPPASPGSLVTVPSWTVKPSAKFPAVAATTIRLPAIIAGALGKIQVH
jgi:hypothetical protein